MDKILTTFKISKYLQVNITTVMSWINQGKLKAYKTPGGHRRILISDFIRFCKKYGMPIPDEFNKNRTEILIVDDEPLSQRLIRRMLEMIDGNLTVVSVQDGFAAGREIEKNPPALVILDLVLPHVDGFKVCQNIKSDPRLKDVKVLAISGKVSESDQRKIMKMGADVFLPKPLEKDKFIEAVVFLLGASSVKVD